MSSGALRRTFYEDDCVDGAHFEALSAAGAAVGLHDECRATGPDGVLRTGEQAGAAALAGVDLGDQRAHEPLQV